jgi:hypothetical protein
MRCRWLWPLALLICVPAVQALAEPQDKPQPDTPQSPGEQYKAVLKELQAAQAEIIKKYREAKTEEEKEQALASYRKVPESFAPRVLDIAEKNPKEAVALDALLWVVSNAGATPQAEKAAGILVQNHLENPSVAALALRLGQSPHPSAQKVLRGIIEKSPNDTTKGQATFALGQSLKGQTEQAGLKKEEVARLAKEAEKTFELVIEKYGAVNAGRGPAAEQAKADLNELRTLGIFKTAPEIEAEDIDGKTFKLSDYRGKVVMLDFWGHW